MLSLFKKRLPQADAVFRKFISPWYPENDRPQEPRPDLYVMAEYEGVPLKLEEMQHLPPDMLGAVKNVLNEMGNMVLRDHAFLNSYSTTGLAFLDALDGYYDSKRVAEIIKTSDPQDVSNPYLVKVCQLGAFIGGLFCEEENYGWLYSYPYFHSIVVEKNTGTGIPVFDWAVKKFSGTGVDEELVEKFQAAHQNGMAESGSQ